MIIIANGKISFRAEFGYNTHFPIDFKSLITRFGFFIPNVAQSMHFLAMIKRDVFFDVTKLNNLTILGVLITPNKTGYRIIVVRTNMESLQFIELADDVKWCTDSEAGLALNGICDVNDYDHELSKTMFLNASRADRPDSIITLNIQDVIDQVNAKFARCNQPEHIQAKWEANCIMHKEHVNSILNKYKD